MGTIEFSTIPDVDDDYHFLLELFADFKLTEFLTSFSTPKADGFKP